MISSQEGKDAPHGYETSSRMDPVCKVLCAPTEFSFGEYQMPHVAFLALHELLFRAVLFNMC